MWVEVAEGSYMQAYRIVCPRCGEEIEYSAHQAGGAVICCNCRFVIQTPQSPLIGFDTAYNAFVEHIKSEVADASNKRESGGSGDYELDGHLSESDLLKMNKCFKGFFDTPNVFTADSYVRISQGYGTRALLSGMRIFTGMRVGEAGMNRQQVEFVSTIYLGSRNHIGNS